jgi:AAA domain
MMTSATKTIAELLSEQGHGADNGQQKSRPAQAWPEEQRGDAWEPLADQSPELPKGSTSRSAFRWAPLDWATFAAKDCRPTWLCKLVLVASQPAVIGGPQKVLKTSIAVDLAISLATGTPWLGKFACPVAKRVAILSGESGDFALQKVDERVCDAKGIDRAELPKTLLWQSTLPQLANLEDLEELRTGLARDRVDVVFIDPAYLCLLAGSGGTVHPENLLEMGPLLLRVVQTCLREGTTPVFLHHTNRPGGRKEKPIDLADLAYSGFPEFARQWILVSRRDPSEVFTGQSHLHLSVGGSVGHNGSYELDVDEGELSEDFTGRKWEVTVTPAGQARQVKKNDKAKAKLEELRRKQIEDETEFQAAFAQLAREEGEPVQFSRVVKRSSLSKERADCAFERLLGAKVFEKADYFVTVNCGAKKPVPGLRRKAADPDREDR